MEEPEPSEGLSLAPNIPRGRVRQQRTVYSLEQREVLESFFQNNHYPCYDEREDLAARLNLQEQQVQVWFKNRRAKYKKTHEATQQPGQAADDSIQGPGEAVPVPALVPEPAPMPAPPAAGPELPKDPVSTPGPGFYRDALAPRFSGVPLRPGFFGVPSAPGFSRDAKAPGETASMGGQGFNSPPPPNAFGGIVGSETSTSSYTQAWWGPTQDTQNPVPAATATTSAASTASAAPVWPEDPYIPNFESEFFECPTLADLLSSGDPLEGPSSLQPGCPKDEESGNEDDSGPKKLLDL